MIIKLIMLRFYFLIPIVLLVLSCLVAQEKPNPFEGIDLRIINMHYDWANFARYEDKNKEVEVIEIDRPNNRAKVKEINMVKKHLKTTKEKKGGIISKESFIHISNIKLVEDKKNTKKNEAKK